MSNLTGNFPLLVLKRSGYKNHVMWGLSVRILHRLQDTVDQSQNSHHASWSKLIYKVGRRAHEFSLYLTKYIAL